MKKYAGFWMLIIIAGLLYGCASPHAVVEGDEEEGKINVEQGKDYDRVIEVQNPLRLSDFLERVPGVRIVGGNVSIRGNPPPLFILDNVQVGYSYSMVDALVNVHDIESVEVLKNPGELAMYGMRGQYGVIIIRTRG